MRKLTAGFFLIMIAAGSARGAERSALGSGDRPGLPPPSSPGPATFRHVGFSESQLDALVANGFGHKSRGSEARVQLFYHYFKASRDPAITAPAWLDASLPSMIRRPAWQDPTDGVLNEAQLWQAPPAVLYDFFELIRKTFPVSRGGTEASPPFTYSDLDADRARYAQAVDRLRRAKLGKSLGGRGRAVIADLLRIVPELKNVRDAAAAGDKRRYISSVMAVASLSDAAFQALQ
ncbi:MAG TPA: hypothetical protein VH309_05495 [Elusimicrobiota bacterium]|jgi:hypothetical protein|nr:hypothetical protein [Elusimicrobiota bacterium]